MMTRPREEDLHTRKMMAETDTSIVMRLKVLLSDKYALV